MKTKIYHLILLLTSLTGALSAANSSWALFKQETFDELPLITGWCDNEKADKIMDVIFESKPNICVEIGAFAGSTTYPIARALQFLQHGIVFAIDAWDNRACVEGLDPNDSNIASWNAIDLNTIKEQFFSLIIRQKLTNVCFPVCLRSDIASDLFEDETIDMLYIDGNFSRQGSMLDVLSFLPKVKRGGYLWINDAESFGKIKAVAHLMKNCTWLKEKSIGKRCLLFKKSN
jgi:hypothetical protein